jgi:histidinol-phosphate/aromatic aminotransferase/cobyric acid decarboxylase-like protein
LQTVKHSGQDQASPRADDRSALTRRARNRFVRSSFGAEKNSSPTYLLYRVAAWLAVAGSAARSLVVIRTLSKAIGLAGARVGYALADPETARKLNARQAPAPISTLSAALALAAHAEPTDVRPLLEERERLAASLRDLGLEPLPSATNFLYVPFERAPELSEVLLGEGMVVRAFPDAIRVTVLDPASNERLLAAVGGSLDRFV